MNLVLRPLRTNLGALVLALLLAFVIWIAASLQTDPFENRRYTVTPLTPQRQPDGTVFYQTIVEQVVVTARARASVLAELRPSSFLASIDLSGVVLGMTATVPISVTCTNEQVRIESVEPREQVVRLEQVRSMEQPVAIQLLGKAATGYRASAPIALPERVTLSGAEPNLSQVVSVTASVNVEGAKKSLTTTVAVLILDAEGRPVPGVELEPKQVEVRVPVLSLAEYKPDVKVVPIVRGDPAPGYRKGEVSVDPPDVTLEGPSWILDRLSNFVETMPITITGATETLSRQSLLTVPLEISVVEVSYVTVTVQILPLLGTRTMTGAVELLRVPPGARAIATPAVVTVTLEGPGAKLAALKEDDVLIFLDLRGYPLGVRYVKPNVLAPEGVAILNVDPETVQVVIELMPTPSPTPKPTARP